MIPVVKGSFSEDVQMLAACPKVSYSQNVDLDVVQKGTGEPKKIAKKL